MRNNAISVISMSIHLLMTDFMNGLSRPVICAWEINVQNSIKWKVNSNTLNKEV